MAGDREQGLTNISSALLAKGSCYSLHTFHTVLYSVFALYSEHKIHWHSDTSGDPV